MKSSFLSLLFIFYFIEIFPAWGQEDSPYSDFQTLIQPQHIKETFLSPFQQNEVHPILWTGLSSVTVLLLKRQDTVDPLQDNWSRREPLGEWSDYGDLMGQMVPNALYSLGMYTHYKYSQNDISRYRMTYMIETTAYAGIFTTLLKYAIAEKRPNGGDRKSFPSGHTTTAFAFASVVGFEHSLYASIPAYILATFVGLSRINDNAHYLHDVVAGATVGIAFGAGLHYLHKKKGSRPSTQASSWQWHGIQFSPLEEGGQLTTLFVF